MYLNIYTKKWAKIALNIVKEFTHIVLVLKKKKLKIKPDWSIQRGTRHQFDPVIIKNRKPKKI